MPEVTQYQREYWNLKGLSKLNLVYKETNGNIRPILKLHQLMIAEDVTIEELFEAVVLVRHLEHTKYAYELREKELKK